ncbi:5-methyltetrahydropteroyltriglutamate--homocysteine S-methyltransferase [Clostridium aminobutyricum]|uniref:5-methyltetrahydropteroyltriglutamate--homocysteine methyltransferase n=1 Tax=Clostridium aminobutyricum TaxID=33953 RepID=A0A939IJL4_CLOAM|nr:5-methyltetrahydropteroyltriglutamate--homocysteine S-methyltransferase [Clostridium aminobutyricum]MBN7774221.1 5-methyltetrahydropteroyltriglutamate--homocysteine S-methyltransferase [Clostridium aminobutyricum]
MKNSIIGYPRIGKHRELKFSVESYFKGTMPVERLLEDAGALRRKQWKLIKDSGLDFIPSNDFSFYDGMLDTANLLNVIPECYKKLNLGNLDTYFAMARGYQGEKGDVKALPMKKWFNTNYHYIVPAMEDSTQIKLNHDKIFQYYSEALEYGVKTKPVIIGPFTFLKLAEYKGRKTLNDYINPAIDAYRDIFTKLNELGTEWIQVDEPILVTDLTPDDIAIFHAIYTELLKEKGNLKVVLQTYFGDVRDCYSEIAALGFDGIGLDFVEGKKSLSLIREVGFPKEMILFAGIINGKNIWRNEYRKSLVILNELSHYVEKNRIVIGTSCSLLHVPYTINNEKDLSEKEKIYFAFAEEKLTELAELKEIFAEEDYTNSSTYRNNVSLFSERAKDMHSEVTQKIESLSERDLTRLPVFRERAGIQKDFFKLPQLPTTTIGSFPQTDEIKSNRAMFKKGQLTPGQYTEKIKEKIKECIGLQEKIGLDVLVHGEFERNDMVEYFGENLDGCLFTQNGWVQSYGTRCVKPPILWGDIKRTEPITIEYLKFAQSLTDKPVKGMLTGPVTILNWSFPREDISLREAAFQIALAIKEEVQDLESNGIRIIQIDEAALKEKLPIRKADWHSEYLDWAIPAFRLVHSGVKATTQIHTHMCYSEFEEIIKEIDSMDADVISFEASRSNLLIIDALNENNFRTAVGPGVYDIHSPRIPSEDELIQVIQVMLEKIDIEKLWINPDCGLKTRGIEETTASLVNMVKATRKVRQLLNQ